MKFIKYICFVFSLIILIPSMAQEAEKVMSSEFDNMYRVNSQLYRSEQPSREGFRIIDSLNIVTVLNLRNRVRDKPRAKKSDVQLERVKINAWRMSYEDLVSALIIVREADKPVLIHCLHGSDRTGAIVAAYRMAFEDWSKEEAIEEFLAEKYGYHEKWFPDILQLLKALDVNTLKRDLEK